MTPPTSCAWAATPPPTSASNTRSIRSGRCRPAPPTSSTATTRPSPGSTSPAASTASPCAGTQPPEGCRANLDVGGVVPTYGGALGVEGVAPTYGGALGVGG